MNFEAGHNAIAYAAFHGRYVVRCHRLNGWLTKPVEVLTLETGKWSAPIELEKGASEIWPVASHLFYSIGGGEYQPPRARTLRAVDMGKGKVIWERQVGGLQRSPFWNND